MHLGLEWRLLLAVCYSCRLVTGGLEPPPPIFSRLDLLLHNLVFRHECRAGDSGTARRIRCTNSLAKCHVTCKRTSCTPGCEAHNGANGRAHHKFPTCPLSPARKPPSPTALPHALILQGVSRSQHNPHCFEPSWCASAPSAPPLELLAFRSPSVPSAPPLLSFSYLVPPGLPDNTPPAPHPHPPVGASQLTAMATLTNQNLAGVDQPFPFSSCPSARPASPPPPSPHLPDPHLHHVLVLQRVCEAAALRVVLTAGAPHKCVLELLGQRAVDLSGRRRSRVFE